MEVPDIYVERFFKSRRLLVEKMIKVNDLSTLELDIIKASTLLSPMVATCGPAGPNVAPFMVTFLVKEEFLDEAVEELKRIREKYWGKGGMVYGVASRFLLNYVYNPEKADILRLASHLMSRGHTFTNIKATGKATLGMLFPPDEGALELRTDAEIVEEGPLYEYVNLLHDLMHAVPQGHASHPWYPAVIFTVREIYDNSYRALGKLIFKR